MSGRAPPGGTPPGGTPSSATPSSRISPGRTSGGLLVPFLVAAAVTAGVAVSGGGRIAPAEDPAPTAAAGPSPSATAGTAEVPPSSSPDLPARTADPTRPPTEGAGPTGNSSLPAPVLLVPGWLDRAVHLEPLRRRFVAAGWPEDRVRALSFEDPVGSNRDHARELARAILELREATGGAEVDVVAHSMGGLALRYHLTNHRAPGVRRAVFLGTPHRGTLLAHAAWGEGSEEMEPGSPLLTSVNAFHPHPLEVRALSVRTRFDLRVVPAESARLPGAANVEVCCPTHEGLLHHDGTFREIVAFLREDSGGPRAGPS